MKPFAAILSTLLMTGCLEEGFECLAPANPGGGWDLTCRAVAQVLAEEGIVSEPIRVRNLPGAGGGVAFAHVVAERRGDGNVIVAASPATTLRLAQGQFGSLKANDVRWLGAVAADYGVLAVRADAPWRDLGDLIDTWRRSPGELVAAGGSAVGGQDHMKLLLLADAAAIDAHAIRYVPFDGGGEAVTALLGGFVAVVSADVSEILRHVEAGSVKVIVAFADDRLGAPLENVATARELGYDVVWVTWRGFYVPADVEPADYARWVETLEALVSRPEWTAVSARRGLAPFYLAGDEFETFVSGQVARLAALTAKLELSR